VRYCGLSSWGWYSRYPGMSSWAEYRECRQERQPWLRAPGGSGASFASGPLDTRLLPDARQAQDFLGQPLKADGKAAVRRAAVLEDREVVGETRRVQAERIEILHQHVVLIYPRAPPWIGCSRGKTRTRRGSAMEQRSGGSEEHSHREEPERVGLPRRGSRGWPRGARRGSKPGSVRAGTTATW
jgi:hypothetical protein